MCLTAVITNFKNENYLLGFSRRGNRGKRVKNTVNALRE